MTLALAGCKIPTFGGNELPAPTLNTGQALLALPKIQYHDYCTAQIGIAEHNARWESLRQGKPVVYKAPCQLAPKAPPATAPASPARTS